MDWNTIGHNINKKYFKSVIANDNLAHAYLFSGQDMIGKKTFVFDLYKLINSREIHNDPDFFIVFPNISEGESKIYIEDIRKLKSFFSLKTYAGPYKVAVIDDAHQLTSEAANALLKILEEPPPSSVIILISSLPGLIPATIVSRCERVEFREAAPEEAKAYLAGKNIESEDKEFLSILAGGKIGLIKNLSDKKSLADAKKLIDDLRKLLGSGIYERMNYSKKVHEKGDYRPRVDYWLLWVSAHLKNSPKNEKITRDLIYLSSIIAQPQYNKRLAFENFLLNL